MMDVRSNERVDTYTLYKIQAVPLTHMPKLWVASQIYICHFHLHRRLEGEGWRGGEEIKEEYHSQQG